MNAIGINHIFYKESSDESRHVENGSYLASYSISANIIILLHWWQGYGIHTN